VKLNLVIGLLGTIVVAQGLYALDRGIWFGSIAEDDPVLLRKKCRYLSLRGISEVPARGGGVLADWGYQRAIELYQLYCRLMAE
jgi:hypothetical protein